MLTTGDVIKIVVAFLMPDNVVAQLVTHYLVGVGDDVDADDTLDEIDSVLGLAWDEIEDLVVDGMAGDTVKLSVWDSVLKQFDEIASKSTSNFDGSNEGEMLPHGAAAVVRFFTNVGRRQGRKFIPGFDEGQQSDGTWEGPTTAALAAFASAWNEQVVVDSTLINQGVFNSGTENFLGFQQSIAVNTIVGYQRRRKAGVGI